VQVLGEEGLGSLPGVSCIAGRVPSFCGIEGKSVRGVRVSNDLGGHRGCFGYGSQLFDVFNCQTVLS
jgi:hypothetical protein